VQAPCLVSSRDFKTTAGDLDGGKKGGNNERQLFGLVSACIAVFIYLYCTVYFDYIKCVQANKYVDFDVKTITAGDYTMEFEITAGMYEQFKMHYLDPTNPLNELAQLKLYI
jgi:hypothetical protein